MKEVSVQDAVYLKLEALSLQTRKSISELVADLVLGLLGEEEKFSFLQELSVEMEEEGERLRKEGDLINSGEAFWRSLSYLMRAVGLKVGLDVSSYQDHYSLVEYLAYKTGNNSLIISFVNAERLHGEFHPRPQNPEEFEFRVKHLKSLLNELRNLIDRHNLLV
ncbi:hypothetical protein GWK48_07985 [Metallosphaera tengchongensis]|uniref:Uncharacterized protein n=1 Tax=Metallosphaera tengchongensis TaxID=1532350 RepID=A0A6N0NUC1_9CREN|nr:PaREP1 family protein [Metallosphaera tengchongensis]QKR00322.1 hypothetical protein GWK48_07985 [Metallosphaera tengchongensis]